MIPKTLLGVIVLSFLFCLPLYAATDPYLRSLDLLSNGRTSEAVHILKDSSADKNYILSDYCANELANIFTASGNSEEAGKELGRILTEYPDSVFAQNVKERYYSKFNESSEVSTKSRLEIAKTFYREGDLTSAITILSSLDQTNSEINYYLGMSFLRKGKILL